jgi:oxygen-independent coproporphyrinogen-3 oxidase
MPADKDEPKIVAVCVAMPAMPYNSPFIQTRSPPIMRQLPPLGLYIHIPWCIRKCPYCDFNSHATSGDIPESAYVTALLADLEQDLPMASGRIVETIFIGGGTPSLLSAEAIHSLLRGVERLTRVAQDAEITLEANPGATDSDRFRSFREASVNRLSIGAQSFDDGHLRSLGRAHDASAAVRAAVMAREAGFENLNLDLMFGLPNQTREDALSDIRTALSLAPAHLSFYQLTLEPNTLFHKYPPSLPADEDIWRIQQACQSALADGGFQQYEVSAYARPGFRCRHNLNYWRFGDYLGIGAGAHGKLTDVAGQVTRSWKARHPRHYLESAGTPASVGGRETVARKDLPLEFLMNSLRLREGFAEADFRERTGLDLDALSQGLAKNLMAGLLERKGGVIRCTDKGWNFLDNALEHFIAG